MRVFLSAFHLLSKNRVLRVKCQCNWGFALQEIGVYVFLSIFSPFRLAYIPDMFFLIEQTIFFSSRLMCVFSQTLGVPNQPISSMVVSSPALLQDTTWPISRWVSTSCVAGW